MRSDHLGHWTADTYIADLFLCFLHSLELRRICDHAVTFPFTLLKVLLVTNLRNTNTVMSGTKWRLKHARPEINHTAGWAVSMCFRVSQQGKSNKCCRNDLYSKMLWPTFFQHFRDWRKKISPKKNYVLIFFCLFKKHFNFPKRNDVTLFTF